MQQVFAVMHKDTNLMPRIHVKRPGGKAEIGVSLGLLAASLLDKLQTSRRTMSQHTKI